MKRYLILGFVLVVSLFFIFGFNEDKVIMDEDYYEEEMRAVFFSYIELSKYIKGYSEDESKSNIRDILYNIDELGLNTLILQVRSFSDAIYESSIFPMSSVIVNIEGDYHYDVLSYFIEEASVLDIDIIAWVNPYRIRGDLDTSDISVFNPAYEYLSTDVVYYGSGVYYNPLSDEVDTLILDGIEEILLNYDISGILFDDYFYPEGFSLVDEVFNDTDIIMEEFRINEINSLIESVYSLCNEHSVLFGISPDGNISNNYSRHYADINTWVNSDKYVDFIMPQIYYGFYNEVKPFYNTLIEWEEVVSDNIELIPALGLYKSGLVDTYAKSGSEEWILYSDIIMREVILSRNISGYSGFSLYRYDSIFGDISDNASIEVSNLEKILD